MKCLDLGVAENSHPLRVAVIIENQGDAPDAVVAADVLFDWQNLLALSDAPGAPQRLSYTVRSPESAPPIKPGERQTIAVDIVWKLLDDPPPMLAVVHTPGVTLTMKSGATIQSQPAVLMLKSGADVPTDVVLPEGLRDKIRMLNGWKAPEVAGLL